MSSDNIHDLNRRNVKVDDILPWRIYCGVRVYDVGQFELPHIATYLQYYKFITVTVTVTI